MQDALRVDRLEARGINVGQEMRARVQAEAVRHAIPALLSSLDASISGAETSFTGPMTDAEVHLRGLRVDTELSRRARGSRTQSARYTCTFARILTVNGDQPGGR